MSSNFNNRPFLSPANRERFYKGIAALLTTGIVAFLLYALWLAVLAPVFHLLFRP